jgi:hypothetical protein
MVHSILQRLLQVVLAGCMTLAGTTVQAMEITTVAGPDGRRSVLARGAIVGGDTERLKVALASADKGPDGLRTIAFDSRGGAVDEAFSMAALMDREKVTVVVRSGATCASACSQILFLAGVHRVVEDGGRLGFHSCSVAGSGTRAPICNEMIARQAADRGASYGVVMAFMQLTGPAQMRWLDAADADCWGLTIWPEGSGRGVKRGDAPPCLLRAPPTP